MVSLGCVYTASGRHVSLVNPNPTTISIDDIAHALAHQCRFAGHTSRFYSVAEHSVHVSLACDPADALHGLLHDASEAFFVDVPKPLKHLPMMQGYREAEAAMQQVIFRRFGLSRGMPASVKVADTALAIREARSLFPVPPSWATLPAGATFDSIVPLSPVDARALFLARWDGLARAAA